MRGRPLRFLGMLTTGWIGLRAVMLWPGAAPVASVVAELPRQIAVVIPTARAAAARSEFSSAAPLPVAQDFRPSQPAALRHDSLDARMMALVGLTYFVEVRSPGSALMQPMPVSFTNTAPIGIPPGRIPGVATASRWSLDGWVLARGGRPAGSFVPELGGAQAGVRLAYAIDEARRAAVFARVATPLRGGGPEAALGVQWRPTRLPVVGFVEARRRAGGEIVPVAGVFGGVDRMPVAERFRLDGYGQAGVIGTGVFKAGKPSGFADGQLRLARPIGHIGPAILDLGAGAWGAVQRGARRLDLGPSIGVDTEISDGRFRLSVDWRQRVAGQAAPASGPVVTLAAGF